MCVYIQGGREISAILLTVVGAVERTRIYISVLPKGRSFTANSGTMLQFCPKAGLPLQTQSPRLQFYLG